MRHTPMASIAAAFTAVILLLHGCGAPQSDPLDPRLLELQTAILELHDQAYTTEELVEVTCADAPSPEHLEVCDQFVRLTVESGGSGQ